MSEQIYSLLSPDDDVGSELEDAVANNGNNNSVTTLFRFGVQRHAGYLQKL